MTLPHFFLHNAMPRIRGFLGRIASDTKGYVAIAFALLALPLAGLTGAAIDIGIAYLNKAELQQAADIVSLQVARQAVRDPDLTPEQLIEKGKGMMAAHTKLPIVYEEFSVETQIVKVHIKAQGSYTTSFAKMIGISQLDFKADSFAMFERDMIDFFVLLDNTPSMLLGATMADVNKMRENMGCEFACHSRGDTDRLDSARSLGVKLRYDAVADAVGALSQRIKETGSNNTERRVALYDFGEWDNRPEVRTALELTKDMDAVRLAVGRMEAMKSNDAVHAGRATDYTKTLSAMAKNIRKSRDSRLNRQQILLLVTDGVNDGYTRIPESVWDCCAWIGPIPVSECTELKNDGVKIAILYTPYFQISHTWWNQVAWEPYKMGELVPRKLEECASPGLFNVVSFDDPSSYAVEMEKLVSKASQRLRLTAN